MKTLPRSIPTTYNGIEFRSRFEADVAKAFDDYGVTWQYEPRSFLLDSGVHYMPDFFLPEIRWWIECRGYVTELGEEQLRAFSRQLSTSDSFIVLRADGAFEIHVSDVYCNMVAAATGELARAFDRAYVQAVAAIAKCNQRRHPSQAGWRVDSDD